MKTFVFALFVLVSVVLAESPVYRVKDLVRNSDGIRATLHLERGRGPFGSDIPELFIEVNFEGNTRVHFKITDKRNKRWEVPASILQKGLPPFDHSNNDYTVDVVDPFGIIVRRKSDGQVLFDSSKNEFVYSNQYIMISNHCPDKEPHIYGIGERVTNFRLDPKNKYYGLWSLDRYAQEAKHLYGAHPFYIEKRGKTAHGILLFNSNAQNIQLNSHTVTYRTIGGVLDFYIFVGPNPENVVKQYQQLIGNPFMPPVWGLGWHQSRYGYKSLNVTRNVWEQYRKHGIPLDVMWNDIDYMQDYKLYTWDKVQYPVPDVQKFVKQLHDNDQKYVVIVDPGVKLEKDYHCYEEGLKRNVYIQKGDGTGAIVNKVWPGFTVFPDFTLNRTQTYWTDMIKQFIDEVPVDGLWIDMNEVACFCDGACGPDQDRIMTKEANDLNHPPYVPFDHKLYYKGLFMDAKSSIGQEYNLHTLYGYFETVQTHKSLVDLTKKRPFIITRSSFPGTGKLAGKWSGDNKSTWSDLFYSISGLLTFNILGIPFAGADICGFEEDATEELCVRWHQLGSFYPFARNHNAIGKRDQEPFAFGPLLIEETRKALLNRYSLLPYYYTLFYNAHVNGGTVIKSIAFEFPNDNMNVVDFLDRQMLVGEALLISPVLDQGASSVYAYLPPYNTTWYDYDSGVEITHKGWTTFSAPISKIPVHIRGGYIVPRQEPGLTTAATTENPYFINVALHHGGAHGSLYMDDGEALDSISAKKYTFITYDAAPGILRGNVRHKGFNVEDRVMNRIVMYGVPRTCLVKLNGNTVSTYTYNEATRVLDVRSLSLPMGASWELTYSC
jgi:alpha-glucosidase (family GH31 glycosyl hydrolase)